MRILSLTLALACLAAPPMAHAQQAAYGLGPGLRAEPVALPGRIAMPTARAEGRTRALEGAIIGAVVGATTTILLTRSGGSSSLCNSSENQDALSTGECVGLAVAGGLAGAGVGALIGSRIRVSALQALPPSPAAQGASGSRVVLAAISIFPPG